MEAGVAPAVAKGGHPLGRQDGERFDREVEPDSFVIAAHGEIEDLAIPLNGEHGEPTTRQQLIHGGDDDVEVVEEGAVPIPENVAVGHGRESTPAGD